MQPLSLYLDTSFIGGMLDEEFRKETERVLELIVRGCYKGVVSELVLKEVSLASRTVLPVFHDKIRSHVAVPEWPREVESLAAEYMKAGVLRSSAGNDAMHVAFATLTGCDLIVSWNFRDLVNVVKKRGFNGVNRLHGLRDIEIVSPLEVTES